MRKFGQRSEKKSQIQKNWGQPTKFWHVPQISKSWVKNDAKKWGRKCAGSKNLGQPRNMIRFLQIPGYPRKIWSDFEKFRRRQEKLARNGNSALLDSENWYGKQKISSWTRKIREW